jgi:nucleoside 2-deoxyribosyltransferase
MAGAKVIYIAGPITGVEKYWEAFEQAEDDLTAAGYIPLSPARLPEGMTNAQYMRTCLAMIDSADAVLFLQDFDQSAGARLERQYCEYVGKPCVMHRSREMFSCEETPPGVRVEWLKYHLGEVFGE